MSFESRSNPPSGIHDWVKDRLSAFMDDALPAEEALQVESHLGTCSECTKELQTLQQTVRWLREMPTRPVPRPLLLSEDAVSQPYLSLTGLFAIFRAVAVVSAALLVIVLAWDAFDSVHLAQRSAPVPGFVDQMAEIPWPDEPSDRPEQAAPITPLTPPEGTLSAPTILGQDESAAMKLPAPVPTPASAEKMPDQEMGQNRELAPFSMPLSVPGEAYEEGQKGSEPGQTARDEAASAAPPVIKALPTTTSVIVSVSPPPYVGTPAELPSLSSTIPPRAGFEEDRSLPAPSTLSRWNKIKAVLIGIFVVSLAGMLLSRWQTMRQR